MKIDSNGGESYDRVETAPGNQPLISWVRGALSSYSWRPAVWSVNGLFIFFTVLYPYLPDNRKGITKLMGLFSLQFERNLATYWEGLCLLLAALLAAERFFDSEKSSIHERGAWLGFGVLTAGLSLDELGSIHERAPLVFSPWGLDGISTLIPLAAPAVLILTFTLYHMFRLPDRRCFWLTIGAFVLLGTVVIQEYLEHRVSWPFWAKGIRVGLEEGTEIAGIFLLLTVVVAPELARKKIGSALDLLPGIKSLIRLKPMVIGLVLLSVGPLAYLTLLTEDFGTPAAWPPFALLILSCMTAWHCAERFPTYRLQFLSVSGLALFFSLDQIMVFQRVVDVNAVHGEVEKIMMFCMAAGCLSVPFLRTPGNFVLVIALLMLNLVFVLPSELYPRLVPSLQCLGVFFILINGCKAAVPSTVSDNQQSEQMA